MDRQRNRYSKMTHIELMEASNVAKPGRDARLIHRELKKYGNGLLFWDRHPILVKIGVLIFDVALSVVAALAILKFLGAI